MGLPGLDSSGKPILAPRLIDGDRRRVCKVEGPDMRLHRDPHLCRNHLMVEDVLGQAGRLGAEEQDIARLIADIAERLFSMSGEGIDLSALTQVGEQRIEVRVDDHVGKIVIVEPCAAQVRVAEVEAERLDQMEGDPRAGRQPDGIAGVGGDAGLIEDDVEHEPRLPTADMSLPTWPGQSCGTGQ